MIYDQDVNLKSADHLFLIWQWFGYLMIILYNNQVLVTFPHPTLFCTIALNLTLQFLKCAGMKYGLIFLVGFALHMQLISVRGTTYFVGSGCCCCRCLSVLGRGGLLFLQMFVTFQRTNMYMPTWNSYHSVVHCVSLQINIHTQ